MIDLRDSQYYYSYCLILSFKLEKQESKINSEIAMVSRNNIFHLEKAQCKDANNSVAVSSNNSSQGRLLIADESTLSRYVAARHDLPISQSLLKRGFKLSIIKRCWEDQLRLKRKCKLYSTLISKESETYYDYYFR